MTLLKDLDVEKLPFAEYAERPGSNLNAARATVDHLRAAGRIKEEDEAIATLVLKLAFEVDMDGGKASLAKEYLAALKALREVTAIDESKADDSDEWIESVSTPMDSE